MKFNKKYYRWIVEITLILIILSAEISKRQIILGLISSFLVLIISEALLNKSRSSRVKIPRAYRILWFSLIVAWEILKAAYEHILRVLSGSEVPRVIHVKLDVEDEFSVAMISNAITLTPGTVTVEVFYNRLTVIGFANTEKDIDNIKNTILKSYQRPFL